MPLSVKSVSIRTKLTSVMAAFVLLNVLTLSAVSYFGMKSAVEEKSGALLAGVARLQKVELERLLSNIDRDLGLQSGHPYVESALADFTRAFHDLDDPQGELQTAYIDRNPHPLGQKDQLLSADGSMIYDHVHRRHHPTFDALQDEMGYYDVFLFDTDGNLVYSVFKERDYATNMQTGEWRDSGLAEVFRLANAMAPDAASAFVDFAPYAPSAGAPAAFIARPVFGADGARLGVMAYQMPIDELNATVSHATAIATESDAFLVSADGYLVTDTPRSAEDDVLTTRFDGPALRRGLLGEDGLARYQDADGNPVLGYFAPVGFLGADWVMIVHERTSSLYARVNENRNFQIVVGLIAVVSSLLVALLFSRGLSLPLQKVAEAMQRVSGREYDTTVPGTDRGDEIGTIANALDDFREELSAAEAGARDAAFKSAAFESTGAPMLLTDLDLRIVGANQAFFRLVNENQTDFGIQGNELSHELLFGRDLAYLSFPPAEIRAAVTDHARLPIKKKVPVGGSYVGLLIDLVRSKDGDAIGYVLDMKNQTFQMMSETVLAAIDAQQARIEFGLDRRVRLANATSCTALGLGEAEVLGRDGTAMISRDDAGDDRRNIWQSAESGQGTGGRFRVRGAGEDRVLEGSFSPIPDQDGNTKGFLLIGGDVTEARMLIVAAERDRARSAVELEHVVDALSDALARVSEGDLSASIGAGFADEYERLRRDFNAATARLGDAMRNVVETADLIGKEAGGINSAVSELSRRTESQAATLEQTTAAMTQLAASVTSSTDEAREAARVAADARASAESSGKIVREAADAMERIETSSQQVSKIIGVIDDIAFQTNLLALNAGVEAARAGDAGRGFAVVASKVRALAQRCLDASNEITSLINVSGESVARGVSLVSETASALESIASSVLRISDNVAHIAEASGEQSNALNEVSTALVNLDQMTQHNAAMAEETTAAARALLGEAETLTRTTARFSLGTGQPGADVVGMRAAG